MSCNKSPWKHTYRLREALNNQLVEAKQSPGRGRGLFALASFRTGDIVSLFTGRLVPYAQLTRIEEDYVIGRPGAMWLVPDIDSVGAHVANHSCRPNTVFYDKDASTVTLKATRSIAAGDEVTVNYGWSGLHNVQCLCGEAHCHGIIGVRHTQRDDGSWTIKHDDAVDALLVAARNRNAAIRITFSRMVKGLSIEEQDRVISRYVISAVERLTFDESEWLMTQFGAPKHVLSEVRKTYVRTGRNVYTRATEYLSRKQ